jgi:hypothetical protein
MGHLHFDRTGARAGRCILHSLALAAFTAGVPGDDSVGGVLLRGRRDSGRLDTPSHRVKADRSASFGCVTNAAASPSPAIPTLKENYTRPSFPIPLLHYDPAHAALPDPKLTPGDTFPGATADDVCTPGWSREHRNVTESMREQVYAEYGRMRGPGCCEVDHLVPLELGGSKQALGQHRMPCRSFFQL